MKEKILFTTTDPEGRTVLLKECAWQHIRTRHPEIKSMSEIRQTVQQPDFIIQNETRQTLSYSRAENMRLYFNVYVRMDSTYVEGSIASAYKTQTLPKGDTIWYRKN